MKRTEEQKVFQTPITVTFGGKDYKIPLLVIRDSRAWRADVVAVLSDLPKYANVTTDEPEDFGNALKALLVTMPDTVIDLFFKYAKDLNKDEIESIATDDEMAEAFGKVVKVAFPLAQSLVGAMDTLAQ